MMFVTVFMIEVKKEVVGVVASRAFGASSIATSALCAGSVETRASSIIASVEVFVEDRESIRAPLGSYVLC